MIAYIPLIAVIAELRRVNRPFRCLAISDMQVFSLPPVVSHAAEGVSSFLHN